MSDTEKQAFQKFLEEFSRYHHGEVTEDGPLPMRFFSNYLTVKEVEGECIDWVFQYLTGKCPHLLVTRLARVVADYVLSLDLSVFIDEDQEAAVTEEAEVEGVEDETQHKPLDPDTVLLVSALAPVVFTKIHSVCDAWDRSLPESVMAKGSKSSVFHQVTTHAIKNNRRKMEDRHVVLPYLGDMYNLKSGLNQSYLAVFDGHGGLYASIYASAHFHDNLVKHPDFDSDPANAIKATFRQTDDEFCNKADREALGSGTTGVCALLRDTMLHVGWLGDSEALLVKDGRPIPLVTPHKPERQDEQDRIRALGGFVEFTDVYRVNGFISVARAIGDRNLKPYLCSDADITSLELDGSEDYLVIGCDGLWDVVTPDEIVSHVYDYMEENDGDKSGVAQMLVKLAQECESQDNITVVVLFFGDTISPPMERKDDCEVMLPPDLHGDDKKIDDHSEKSNMDESEAQETSQEATIESNLSTDSGRTDEELKMHSKITDSVDVEGANLDVCMPSEDLGSKHDNKDAVAKTRLVTGEVSGNNISSENMENSASKDMFGSKDVSGSKDTSASKECTESKEGWASYNKASSGVTSNSNSSPYTNMDKLRLSLHLSSFRDSKDSSDLAKDRKEKSSSRSSKARSAHSDTFSAGSGASDIIIMTQTASKCIGNRRGRRGRNGRRRNNHKDNRRASRESQSSGIALRTNSTPSRVRSSSESKVSSFVRTPIPSSRSGGENTFRMLMGCGAQVMNRAITQNRWTVAVAMETDSAAAMFDEVIPTVESPAVPSRQKKKYV